MDREIMRDPGSWRPLLALTVPALLVLVAGVALTRNLRAASGSGPLALGSQSTRCEVEVEKSAAPETVVIGDEAELALAVRVDCASAALPAHVALVFDNSTLMGGQRMNDMKRGVSSFVEAVDFSVSRVGLASYSGRVEYLAELTDDPDEIVAASEAFFPEPGSDLTRALAAGRLMLERGRDEAAVDEYLEAIVLFVGSPNDGEDSALIAQSAALRAEGTLVVTIAATASADLELLEAIATAPTFFHVETMSTRYPFVLQEIASGLSSVQPLGADVIDLLPQNMEYVWGSGIPVPRIDGAELRWRYDVWPAEGIDISYALKPMELGCHKTNEAAEVEVRFDRGDPQKHAFPAPSVCAVTAPSATPRTPTATPSPTHPPRPRPVFVPLVWRDHCASPFNNADVALVVDTSSSMMTLAAGGVPRAQIVQEAASRLVDELALGADTPAGADTSRGYDRAAVVAASGRSSVLAALSGDRGTLQSAIAGMFRTMEAESLLAPALADATGLLDSRGRSESSTPAIVVLTDGFDDRAGASVQAESARAAGYAVFTIGLGSQADREALAEIAGRYDRHVWSEDGSELVRAALGIVEQLHCGLR